MLVCALRGHLGSLLNCLGPPGSAELATAFSIGDHVSSGMPLGSVLDAVGHRFGGIGVTVRCRKTPFRRISDDTFEDVGRNLSAPGLGIPWALLG